MTETPAEKIERLSHEFSEYITMEVGKASCGCPNDMTGCFPKIHICPKCGFESNFVDVHKKCLGCQDRKRKRLYVSKNQISDRWYPR